MAGERAQFARVGAFVQGEENQSEIGLVAEPVQQRLERMHVVGTKRNIRAFVAPVTRRELSVVVAEATRMDLHHQAIVHTHAGHFGEHLAAKDLRIPGAEPAAHDSVEQTADLVLRQVGRSAARMPVVGRGGAHLREERAALAVRAQIALPGTNVFTGESAELLQRGSELFVLGVDHRIGTVGGDHTAVPSAGADRGMVEQGIERRFGSGDHFDVEALEQRTRPEVGLLQRGSNRIVVVIGSARVQSHTKAEHVVEDVVEPHGRRRAPEQVEVRRQYAPCLAWVGFGAGAVGTRNSQRIQRNSLAVEHPEHVMVRDQQQLGGIGEGGVVGEPCGVGMAVRADDGQVRDLRVQAPRDRARDSVGGEEAVLIQCQGFGAGFHDQSAVVVVAGGRRPDAT